MLKNIPVAGIFDVSATNATPKAWSKNKDKYIGKQPKTSTDGVFGYFILDLDIKRPDDNLDKLLKYLSDTLHIDINTFMVRSKSGGMHLYYKSLPFAHADTTSWLKTDYGVIDIRGSSTWVRGPTMVQQGENLWRPGQYAIINDIPPIDFNKPDLVQQSNVTTMAQAKGGRYWLGQKVIPEGERNAAVFQILTHWYRQGKDVDEVEDLFHGLHIEGFDEWEEQEKNIRAKYQAIVDREQEKHGGQEDKLVVAMRDWVYISGQDKIYSSSTRKAYPRVNFKFTVDNKYEILRENKLEVLSLTDVWLAQSDKRHADDIGWKPIDAVSYNDFGEEYVNTYRDRTYMAKEELPRSVIEERVKPWLMVVDNVFMGDKDAIAIYLSSVKWQLEHPLEPRTWSLTIVGNKGTGKGTLWATLNHLLGGYGISPDPATLKKEFNSYLFGCNSLLFDEMDTQGTAARFGALKKIISDNAHNKTAKGSDTEGVMRSTYFSVEIHANSTQGMRLEQSDRRHFLIHCTNPSLHARYGDAFVKEYYNSIGDETTLTAITQYLMAYSYHSDFSHAKNPMTAWYKELCSASKGTIATDLLDALHEDNVYSKSDIHTPSTLRLMLIELKGYPETFSPGKCGAAISELVSDGTFKVIKERGNMAHSIEPVGLNEVKKVKHRSNPKIVAIRHHDKYVTLQDAQAAFFSHLP